jgi:glycosyltransferase involved in cell wall biosynthesis
MATTIASIGEAARTLPAREKALRVLTLTPFYPSAEDLVNGSFVAEPLALMAQLGVEPTVLAVQPLHHRSRSSCANATPAEWRRFPALPGRIGLADAGRILFWTVSASVSRQHLEEPFDLIHAHAALPCGYAAMRLSERLQIPFVVTVHGLDAYSTRQVTGFPGHRCEDASRSVFESAARVICVSDRVRGEVLRRAKKAVGAEVVYNGVDTRIFAPEPGQEKSDVILSVGNLQPGKGHELLLRGFAPVASKFPQLRCHILGDGPQRSRLQQAARQLGIADKVRFLGKRNRLQVAEAMKQCLLFALPSSYEALGCVYLEAMACGKAAVACSGQGIDEIIRHGENGWLIRPNDLEEMTHSLTCLATSKRLRDRIGSSARQTVLESHTMRYQTENLAKIYRECVN